MKHHLEHDFRHVFWVGLSTGGNALLGFIAGMLLVRCLPAAEYGLLSAAIAVLLVAQEFVGRGINDGLVRLGACGVAGSADRTCHIFRAGLVLKTLFGLAILVSFVTLPSVMGKVFGFGQLREAFPALAMAITGYGFWTYNLTWLQTGQAFGKFAMLQPLGNLLRFGAYLGFIVFTGLHWLQVLWIIAGAFWIAALLTVAPLVRALRPVPIRSRLFKEAFFDLWRCTRWSILSAVAYVALTRMDIFALTHFTGTTEVAYYNAAWQVLVIVDLATVTIMTVMAPKAAQCSSQRNSIAWIGRTLSLSAVTAVLCLPLVIFPEWYIPLILGAQYEPSVTIVQILFSGNLLGLLAFPLVGLIYARDGFHLNAIIQVLLLAISIPAYTMAAKHSGIIGVAWTTLALRALNATLIVACTTALLLYGRRPLRDKESSGPIYSHPTREAS